MNAEIVPSVNYAETLKYARAMRQQYITMVAELEKLSGHECGNQPGECGDTEDANLWHIAAYLPDRREPELLHALTHQLGCPVYRAWPVERETHGANVAGLAHSLSPEPA